MVNYFPYQNYTTICEQLIEKQKLVKKNKETKQLLHEKHLQCS